jgi:glycosyltransferase involved in cell wall biosynthesis/SAM-dependent methyltransferase
MDICTIIASNYVAFARVLAHSHRRRHPESRRFALVIDDHQGRIDAAAEPFELITPADLDIEHFDRMAALYNVLELSTAVKPWLLRHLLGERGCETVAYLDPDIEIFDRLDEIDALAREHRLVVTPHLTAPMPRDGRKPSETDILIAGSYNLGFIGLAPSPDTTALLDWWAERLETDCVIAPERGYFVDQRWMDFAPGLVPTLAVLRDPGYNVAYWNLPSREVEQAGDGWTVNSRPLRFFHYSGFDPRRPDELSKHQDRIALGERPVLRDLCARYAEQLLREGYEQAQRWPYGYDELPGGVRLDAACRLAIRRAIEAGELDASPFTEQGAEALLDYLTSAPGRGGARGVSRYLLALRELEPDLRAAFPDLAGDDGRRYVGWAQTIGRSRVPIPEALVPGARRRSGAPAAGPNGVNVAGYFRSIVGVGEAARQVVGALQSAGVEVATVELDASASRQDESLGAGPGGSARHGVNLICVNADVLVPFADKVGPEFFAGRYSIGMWWWEVSTFPERWMSSFEHVDEVWAGSRHVADALSAVSPVPVVHVPQPVRIEPPAPVGREALGLPDGYLFLFSFDYHSVFERKNPLAAIEAFRAAFATGEGAQLVIKTINHDQHPRDHARLVEAAAQHPDVHLYERYVSRADRDAITAGCDCYVSLHRSEGFGFTVAEAMALGRPAIVTAYSGTMDFTTAANSYLVDHELVPIGPGADPYPPDGVWAAPDVEHAARLMRAAFEDPEEARRKGERAREDLAERHSPEAAGRIMRARLDRIRGPAAVARRPAPVPGSFDVAHARSRAATGPPTPASYRFGKPQQFARQALLRGLKPYTAHARTVDLELIRGLEAVDRSVVAADDRITNLAGQVDELRADLGRALGFLASFGVGDGAAHGDALGLGGWPEAPLEPWTPEYFARHGEYVTRALDDPALLNLLKSGRPLPPGYGVGFDERVVEFPWTLTRDLGGRVLDAGSTLNHPNVLIRVRPRVDDLHIVTLAPETQAFPFIDVSYLYADLRELPIRDATYDRVLSISTLEHVGMDNTQYGDTSPRSSDPRADLVAAISELRRVLKPGGTLYVTVPYGRPADLGWQRVFDAEGLEALVEAFAPAEQKREFFRYTAAGWERSSAGEATGAEYRDHFSDPTPAPDRAVAARAIACLALR